MRVPALFAFILASVLAQSQDFGPIPTRNHRALSLAFMRFEPRSSFLDAGQTQFDFSITSANDFRILPRNGDPVRVHEDYEVERVGLAYRKGLHSGCEFSVELPLMSRGGGFLDNIINWWHTNVLHWSDPFRVATPTGQSVIGIPGGSFGSAAGIGAVGRKSGRFRRPRSPVKISDRCPASVSAMMWIIAEPSTWPASMNTNFRFLPSVRGLPYSMPTHWARTLSTSARV